MGYLENEHQQQNLLQDLVKLLWQDDRLVIEDQLLKNKVIELALALDSGLIRLLLSSEEIRRHFFQNVDGVLVFDKIKFQRFVSNKAFLPDSYTAFKNKIGLTAEGSYLTDNKEVVLAWPYKDCVLEGGQTKEDAKRNEIFWNETLAPDQIDRLLAPKVLTNFKKYDKDGEHQVMSISRDDNLIIKGNNLLALHTLKKVYAGRVKLIFIDPPFNTENDSFQYNDSFSQSSWLTFLQNRLQIAKTLMSKDGSIFLHIDHDHSHIVKLLMDGIFGADNFRNEIILPGRAVKNLQRQFETIKKLQVRHDTLFWYTKNPDINFRPLWVDKHDVGNTEGHWHHAWSTEERKTMQYELLGTKIDKGQWVWGEERALMAVKNYERYIEEGSGRTLAEYWRDTGEKLSFIRKSDDGKPLYWRAPAEKRIADTVWSGIPIANSDFGFKTSKNEKYLAEVIKLASEENDLVMDFFAGSGTTLSVAHKLYRRWIGIEQMDYINSLTVERLKKCLSGEQGGISKSVNWQGGGSFLYCELAKANQTFVDQIQGAVDSERLTEIWQMMQEEAFLSYRIDPKTIDLASADFTTLNLDDQKRFLIEVMDKNMLYVPASEIDDVTYGISDEDKKLNRQLFGE